MFIGGASNLIDAINIFLEATAGCVSCVNTIVAFYTYLKVRYVPEDIDHTCGINCNNNFLVHMKLQNGPLIITTMFMLFQKLAHLQKAYEDEGADKVTTILDDIKSFFAVHKVIPMPPRVLLFLFSISDQLEELGVQLIE